MRVDENTICKQCKRIFCCADCRHKHEINTHAIIVYKHNKLKKSAKSSENVTPMANEKIYLLCPICEEQPLVLQEELYEELVQHIQTAHLPLRCQKCCKIYRKIDDLKNFSKCLSRDHLCISHGEWRVATKNQTSDTIATKDGAPKTCNSYSTISTQTSPMRQGLCETILTPISVMHLKEKYKIKEEFISDSVSSIKNLSTICTNTCRRSIGNGGQDKGGLIRSTSTPVQLEMVFAKPRDQAFNATSVGHVSSIYGSSSESEISPAVPNTVATPRQAVDNLNRYRKVGGRVKITAVTPLRQVMSKSIQKAFAEHGGLPTKTKIEQRKNVFEVDHSNAPKNLESSAPLDLRMSPVIRRTQSESSGYQVRESIEKLSYQYRSNEQQTEELILSSQQLKRESLVITRTKQLGGDKNIQKTTFVADNQSTEKSPSNFNTTANSYNSNSNYLTANNGTSNSSSSVFKTCHSVEIITSTEVNGKMEEQICCTRVQCADKLNPMHNSTYNNKQSGNLTAHTPIARIPGSQINKKVIQFETPNFDDKTNINSSATPGCNSVDEVFFTPNSTPMRNNNETLGSSERKRQLIARNLTRGFSPFSRPSIRECAQSTAFSRIEDCLDTFEDEVFLFENERSNDCKGQRREEFLKIKGEEVSGAGTGRLWSLMSSVMRLGSSKENCAHPDESKVIKSKSILKRCASIAGSFVRSKPLVDDEQFQCLKRKRTYTTDQSTCMSYANVTDDYTYVMSSKRFRIQGRKPIDRMRQNS